MTAKTPAGGPIPAFASVCSTRERKHRPQSSIRCFLDGRRILVEPAVSLVQRQCKYFQGSGGGTNLRPWNLKPEGMPAQEAIPAVSELFPETGAA